jgi:uncharacterized protein (DUF983 family)
MMLSRSLSKALTTALKLRCPRCGEGALFRGPFTMNNDCAHCHLVFEREPGYFVGAIYINYAVTAGVAIAGFLLLDACTTLSVSTQMVLWGIFGISFPLFFFRYSKSLWLAFDHLVSPEDHDLRVVRGGRA